MIVLDVLLWVIQIVNAADHYSLNRFGLRPRIVGGLWGVLASPLLSHGYGHLLADSAPFVLLGWVVLLSGVRPFVLSTVIVLVAGGLASWLVSPGVSPAHALVGVVTLTVGWLGYLLGRAYFSRRIVWIAVAVLVVFFFGGLFGDLLPGLHSGAPWQQQLCSFGAGILASALLHPRRARSSKPKVKAP
jgi:hypothetical protein